MESNQTGETKKEEVPKPKEEEKKEDKDNKDKKEAPPRKENEFIIKYVLSSREKRQEKYDKELKMFEKKEQMTQMMEEEMRKKMRESRERFDFDLFGGFKQNDKLRKEREKNVPEIKKTRGQRPVLNLDIEKLRLFGEHFVQKNKEKCKLIIEEKEMDRQQRASIYYKINS